VVKGPAQRQLEHLDECFGPGYFEHGRLVFTVARDVHGVMKVAHRVQAKVNEALGSMVEVIMEHVKQELWLKLHESAASCSLKKGMEVPECQVTNIPDGIRHHPYRRDHLPTLEVLFLWDDSEGITRGRVLYTCAHPEVPSMDQVDDIFAQVEPYFAKRWLQVQLCMAPPVIGEFDEPIENGREDGHVGAGAAVTLLACHPLGFASDPGATPVTHVSLCQPICFKAMTDHAGQAKICFLPAALNKIKVEETDRFHGTEVTLLASEIKTLEEGCTQVTVRLTPKSTAGVTVHVFQMPRKMPPSEETDGIIDWAAEERVALDSAVVEVTSYEDSFAPVVLKHTGQDAFFAEAGGLSEGCVNIQVSCPGYEPDERTVMLLVGPNEFYIPLQAA